MESVGRAAVDVYRQRRGRKLSRMSQRERTQRFAVFRAETGVRADDNRDEPGDKREHYSP